MAGIMVTWLQKTEKFRSPSALARLKVRAVEGAVVSNPMAKNMTWRSGLFCAILQRIGGRVDNPHVHAARLIFERASLGPGTRIMSPNAVKITSALRPSTGHRRYAPWAARTPGSRDREPARYWAAAVLEAEAVDGVGVAAAHFHESVAAAGIGQTADLLSRLVITLGSRNSSTNFMIFYTHEREPEGQQL